MDSQGYPQASLAPQGSGWLKTFTGLPRTLWHWAVGCHHDEQTCGGEMGKKRWSGLCAVERKRPKEAKAEKNRMMWVVCLAPKAMVTSGPGCCQGPCLGP